MLCKLKAKNTLYMYIHNFFIFTKTHFPALIANHNLQQHIWNILYEWLIRDLVHQTEEKKSDFFLKKNRKHFGFFWIISNENKNIDYLESYKKLFQYIYF